MKVYQAKTKNGRTFRVVLANASQEKRFFKVVEQNKKKSYEVFTSIKCINNGIHDIKAFEVLANNLV